MDVTELYSLAEWVHLEIEGKQVIAKYQALHSILNANTQPNQQKQPFEQQKEELREVLRNVELNRLTVEQLEFLRKLGIAEYVGTNGVENIEDILVKNVIDIATAATRVKEIIQSLQNGVNKSKQFKEGIEGCIEVEGPVTKDILIRISFSNDAAMSNIADFKKWGNIWHDIARGVTMIHGEAPENVRIVGAHRGSIVLEIAVTLLVARTFADIILKALEVAERALSIRKKVEEIKGLKLSNHKIAIDLEKEIENVKETSYKSITDEIVSGLKLKPEERGDKLPALDKAVKDLVNFIDKGGEIDCYLPLEEEEKDSQGKAKGARKDSIKELRNSFAEIRKLESRIKRLDDEKN